MNKNSNLTRDKEKPTVKETSASCIDKIVPDIEHVSNDMAEQCSSSAGGQNKSNHIGSGRIGLTGWSDRSDLSETRNSGGVKNRTKPIFEELLDKYKKISEQKQSNQLEGKRKRNSSPPRSRKHQRSSYWSSSFISSMHVPWTTYSGVFNP